MASTKKQIVSDWSRNTMSDFQAQLRAQKIGIEGDLSASLASRLGYDHGDVNRVSFKFLRYGVFVELGVGRGVPIETAIQNRLAAIPGKRVAKPWYNPVIDQQLPELADKILSNGGDVIINALRIGQRASNGN